jgi:hypothetical protein
MKKRICLILVLLVISIINANVYNSVKFVDYNGKDYICTYVIKNDEFDIEYNYVFNINTDSYGHITNSDYYEEFKYGIDTYYNSSKDFYLNDERDFKVSVDDDNRIIKLSRTDFLNVTDYSSFKEYIEDTNFKCEEKL